MKYPGLKDASSFRLAVSIAILGLVWTATFTPAAAQGSAEQQQACTPDAFRLCSEFIPDVAKVGACMNRKRASLSPACRATMTVPSHGRKRTPHHHSA